MNFKWHIECIIYNVWLFLCYRPNSPSVYAMGNASEITLEFRISPSSQLGLVRLVNQSNISGYSIQLEASGVLTTFTVSLFIC